MQIPHPLGPWRTVFRDQLAEHLQLLATDLDGEHGTITDKMVTDNDSNLDRVISPPDRDTALAFEADVRDGLRSATLRRWSDTIRQAGNTVALTSAITEVTGDLQALVDTHEGRVASIFKGVGAVMNMMAWACRAHEEVYRNIDAPQIWMDEVPIEAFVAMAFDFRLGKALRELVDRGIVDLPAEILHPPFGEPDA